MGVGTSRIIGRIHQVRDWVGERREGARSTGVKKYGLKRGGGASVKCGDVWEVRVMAHTPGGKVFEEQGRPGSPCEDAG